MTIDTSVIIPVYQDLAGLQACLLGLSRQSMPGEQFEVIVVDNGSKPSIELPECGLPNLRIVRCAAPGSYAARNAGVQEARGRWLAFTDADCIPHPHWLEKGLRALQEAGATAIVGGEVQFTDPPWRSAVALYQMAAGFQQAENIAEKGFSATANLFCARPTFDAIGPFDAALLSGGDREWAWRALGSGIRTLYAPDAIVATKPRTTLAGAIRQARRVAAGRHHLRRSGLAARHPGWLRPHRGVLASLHWLATHEDLGMPDRMRVLAAAGLIKLVSLLESVRIRLGGRAERR